MIKDYIGSLAVEPAEMQALQVVFDGLKVRLCISEPSAKDMLGMLLMGAYNANRDILRAEGIAEQRYRNFLENKTKATPVA